MCLYPRRQEQKKREDQHQEQTHPADRKQSAPDLTVMYWEWKGGWKLPYQNRMCVCVYIYIYRVSTGITSDSPYNPYITSVYTLL